MRETIQRVTQTQELGAAYCDVYFRTTDDLENGFTPEAIREAERMGELAARLDQQWPHFAELWHRAVMQAMEDALAGRLPCYSGST